MIELGKNERVLLILHRHWIVLVPTIIATLVLFLFPFFMIPFEGVLTRVAGSAATPLLLFLSSIYWMVVFAFFFASWISYWLDVWIITTERVIDIEQLGLFNRKVSDINLSRIQDVTVNTPDVVATMFKYGNILIQTAGEVQFSIRQVPRCEEAKRIITGESERRRVAGGSGAV